MTTNLPPRRVVEDQVQYEVVLNSDTHVRFRVIAESETAAKVQALDKIGYAIVPGGARFVLVDAEDTDDVETVLQAKTLERAFDEAFKHIGWTIDEPVQMIGGALGEGFGDIDDE